MCSIVYWNGNMCECMYVCMYVLKNNSIRHRQSLAADIKAGRMKLATRSRD